MSTQTVQALVRSFAGPRSFSSASLENSGSRPPRGATWKVRVRTEAFSDSGGGQ